MFHSPRSRASQSGFTLLEVTLVLALLVVMAAIVWPALERPLATERLRYGADKVRTEWTRTRIRAMTMGSPHVFRYQPGTNVYQVEVWHGADAPLEAAVASDFGTPLESGIVTQAVGEKGLPDGVVFDANQMLQDVRSLFVAADPGSAEWSEPIYFFPDGTTSHARLLLRNELDLYIVLDLRGLTGVTKVSDVMTVDELPQ
jgi:prepilin-type N-terminal cleavage/methylation domain-containing protein